jgi:short subunit dehydrogenase-like uncharacterized protein
LILYGATGYTGRKAALYIAKQYGRSFRWAIAGRRADALEEVRRELASINSALADLPIVIADSSNSEGLSKMVGSTKVVISTVGKLGSSYTNHNHALRIYDTAPLPFTPPRIKEWFDRNAILYYHSIKVLLRSTAAHW